MRALLLSSVDGDRYIHVVLYPPDWTVKKAREVAEDAFAAAKADEEWTWDEIKEELDKRGIVELSSEPGPVWDE